MPSLYKTLLLFSLGVVLIGPMLIISNPVLDFTKEICEVCHIAMPIIRSLLKRNKTAHLNEIISVICREYDMADEMVCNMAVKSYEVNKKNKHQISLY